MTRLRHVASDNPLGKAFNDSRIIIIPWVVLPVIGLLARIAPVGGPLATRLLVAGSTPGVLE